MTRIRVDGGVRLSVQDLNPRGRKTVVFVHGWPLNHEIFETQYNVLPSYGIRCVGVDLRGYGASDRPWHSYSYNQMADDLCKCIKALELNNITLCGFSMGGAVCARYMSRYRGAHVGKLVLMGAACPSFVQRPGYPYGMTKEQVDILINQVYSDRPLAFSQFGAMCFSQQPSPQYQAWFNRVCDSAASWAAIGGLEALRDEDLRADLAKIRIPTAIFHGVRDQVCPYAFAQEMQGSIPASFVVPFEQSGHCLFKEESEKCNLQLVDFIGSW